MTQVWPFRTLQTQNHVDWWAYDLALANQSILSPRPNLLAQG